MNPTAVGLYVPSWDGWIRAELHTCIFEAFVLSFLKGDALRWFLAGHGTILHRPIANARAEIADQLKPTGPNDLVVMVDADQAIEAPGLELGAWLDVIVKQWRSGRPDRLLFGVTPFGYQGEGPPEASKGSQWARAGRQIVNYARDDGRIIRCGAGVLVVPAVLYARVRERWPNPWQTDARFRAEDILFSERVADLGFPIEPLHGIRVLHWPEWREPLTHTEPDHGSETQEDQKRQVFHLRTGRPLRKDLP